MPIPRDFLHDASGDLDLSLGLRQTSDLPTFVRQKFSENFNVFQGEYFLDLNKGLPMFRHIVGAHFDEFLLSTIYRRAAQKTHGVGSVESLLLDYDNAARLLDVRVGAKTVEGEDVSAAEPFVIGVS